VHPRREARSGRVLSPIRILLTSPRPPALGRNERKGARAQRRKGRGPRAEIRLLGHPPCSVVGYAAEPASPTLRKTSKPLGLSPEGGTSLPVCVSHRTLADRRFSHAHVALLLRATRHLNHR
jgi:hypothetical protein